jgi:hypothetical protein
MSLWPFAVSVVVTALRFFGERAEVSSAVTFMLGVIWVTLIVAAYWAWKLKEDEKPYRLLFLALFVFAWISRVPIVLLWWVARSFDLGTHYDMYRDFRQALLFQFGVSALVQILAGGVVGSLALVLLRFCGRPTRRAHA